MATPSRSSAAVPPNNFQPLFLCPVNYADLGAAALLADARHHGLLGALVLRRNHASGAGGSVARHVVCDLEARRRQRLLIKIENMLRVVAGSEAKGSIRAVGALHGEIACWSCSRIRRYPAWNLRRRARPELHGAVGAVDFQRAAVAAPVRVD